MGFLDEISEKLPFLVKNKIIGVDIGSFAIKVAEIEEKGTEYLLKTACYTELPPTTIVEGSIMNSAAVTDALIELTGECALKVKQVATSVGGSSVIVKQITVTTMTPEELDEQITWEAEQHITFSVDEVNLAYHIIGESEVEPGKMDIILVAAKRDMISDYTTVLIEAGFSPVIIDINSFAMMNVFEVNYPEERENVVALVNIGASFTNVNITKNGIPIVVRDFTIGSNSYTEEIQKNLGVSSEEAEQLKRGDTGGETGEEVIPQEVVEIIDSVSDILAGEISRTIDFYGVSHPEEKITKVLLSGGGALTSGLQRIIEEKTDIPTHYLDPFKNITVSDTLISNKPEIVQKFAPIMVVPVGLALRRRGDS